MHDVHVGWWIIMNDERELPGLCAAGLMSDRIVNHCQHNIVHWDKNGIIYRRPHLYTAGGGIGLYMGTLFSTLRGCGVFNPANIYSILQRSLESRFAFLWIGTSRSTYISYSTQPVRVLYESYYVYTIGPTNALHLSILVWLVLCYLSGVTDSQIKGHSPALTKHRKLDTCQYLTLRYPGKKKRSLYYHSEPLITATCHAAVHNFLSFYPGPAPSRP